MLPSFRLIAATFLCGFVMVFAGLRLAATLNDIHAGLPVTAAFAAPAPVALVADPDARRGLAAVPVMYDLRFAIGRVSPALVRLPPTAFDSIAPLLSILPQEDLPETEPGQEAGKEAVQPDAAIAAIPPATPMAPEPVIVPDTGSVPPAPEAPPVAAIDPQDNPDPLPAEQPAGETAAPATIA